MIVYWNIIHLCLHTNWFAKYACVHMCTLVLPLPAQYMHCNVSTWIGYTIWQCIKSSCVVIHIMWISPLSLSIETKFESIDMVRYFMGQWNHIVWHGTILFSWNTRSLYIRSLECTRLKSMQYCHYSRDIQFICYIYKRKKLLFAFYVSLIYIK